MGPRKSVLLVDSDTRHLGRLEVSLEEAGFRVLTAKSTQDALELARQTRPDVVVTDSQLCDDDGFAFARRLKGDPVTERTGMIFLAYGESAEAKVRSLDVGSDVYLMKPDSTPEILARITEIFELQRIESVLAGSDRPDDISGTLANMGIVDLLQRMAAGRHDGTARLSSDPHQSGGFVSGTDGQGTLFFRDGQVVDARLARLPPIEAVYRMLLWEDGAFDVELGAVERSDVIQTSTQLILLEGMRRVDEWTKLAVRVPPLATRLTLNLEALSRALPVVPDEMQSVLQLFDRRRTVLEVIDDAPMRDLDALALVAELHAYGTLVAATEDADPDPEHLEVWASPPPGPNRTPGAANEAPIPSSPASSDTPSPNDAPAIDAPAIDAQGIDGQGIVGTSEPQNGAEPGGRNASPTTATPVPGSTPNFATAALTALDGSGPRPIDTVPGNVARTMPVTASEVKPVVDATSTAKPTAVSDERHGFFSNDDRREVAIAQASDGSGWKRPLVAIAAGVALVAAVVIGAFSGVLDREAPRAVRNPTHAPTSAAQTDVALPSPGPSARAPAATESQRTRGPAGPGRSSGVSGASTESAQESQRLVEVGRRHVRRKRFRRARRSFGRALKADPDNAAAYAELSMVWVKLEKDRRARAAAWRALKLDREQARAHLALAIVYANADEPDKAKRYYRSFLRYEKTGKVADEVRRILANLP